MYKIFSFLLITSFGFAQSSNLPILRISTNGKSIVDEPKTEATLEVFWKGANAVNTLADSPVIKQKIGVELRGSSSQGWPKKPYGFELWDDKNQATEISFFGWPKESDYVLFASYNERSLMHNVLAQYLARSLGLAASRTQYCELYLNGNYQGVYVFMEKVKQGKGRVEIATLKPEESSGDALTGGYMIKVDKTTGSTLGGWSSKLPNPGNNLRTYFQYEYPKTITSAQKTYIRSFVDSLETALASSKYSDSATGYRRYLNVESFAKYLLVNELSRNVDGYRISSYFYKDKNSKDRHLYAGPAWDYDLTFGNADYCDGWKTTGWAYDFNYVCPGDGLGVPFWWERLVTDQHFLRVLQREYRAARKTFLSDKNIMSYIDSTASVLQKPAERNFTKWNRLGQYDWPIPRPIPSTYAGEVGELKVWLSARLQWLDANLPMPFVFDDKDILAGSFSLVKKASVFPNPFTEKVYIDLDINEPVELKLTAVDLNGADIGTQTFSLSKGQNKVEIDHHLADIMNRLTLIKLEYNGKTEVLRLMKK